MSFALRGFWFVPAIVAGLSAGCMGRADLSEGDPSAGSSGSGGGGSSSGTGSSGGAGSSSSSGSNGSSSGATSSSGGSSSSGGRPQSSSSSSGGITDPDCSRLAVPDIARTCPDGSSVGGEYVLSNHQCVLEFPCPPGGQCSQGSTCNPGTACGSPVPQKPNCSTTCTCDSSRHYQCATGCMVPPDNSCTQGAACTPGSGCGMGDGTCTTSCKCLSDGFLECNTTCKPPPVTNPCPDTVVPDVCQVCSNGITECAHAILVKGMCTIEICPGG